MAQNPPTWFQCGVQAIKVLAEDASESKRERGFQYQTEIWETIKRLELRGTRYGQTPHATLNQVIERVRR